MRCSDWDNVHHSSWKSKSTYRTFNVVVNHSRRILHSTDGYPGTYNDMNLQERDEFLCDLNDGTKYSDLEYELYEMDIHGNEYKRKYKGT